MVNRLRSAITCTHAIRHTPHPYHTKARIIHSKSLSMGLYGAASTHVDEVLLSKFCTATAQATGPASTIRCNSLHFARFPLSADPDPYGCLLQTRVMGLRRCVAVRPKLQDKTAAIVHAYKDVGYMGTDTCGSTLASLTVAPPPLVVETASLGGPRMPPVAQLAFYLNPSTSGRQHSANM